MRILLVMRGIPGCGKSTWIKEHELEAYTLSPDNIGSIKLHKNPYQTRKKR